MFLHKQSNIRDYLQMGISYTKRFTSGQPAMHLLQVYTLPHNNTWGLFTQLSDLAFYIKSIVWSF